MGNSGRKKNKFTSDRYRKKPNELLTNFYGFMWAGVMDRNLRESQTKSKSLKTIFYSVQN